MPYKDIAIELIILLSLSFFIAFSVNFFSPRGIALFGEWDTLQGVITAKSKDDIVVHELEIEDVRKAKEIYDSGKALFVDARVQELYEDGHIKRAVSLPINKLDLLIDKFINEYPISTWIVTYCSGRECQDSHKLAQYLFERGYINISVLADGYPDWEGAGYPIER